MVESSRISELKAVEPLRINFVLVFYDLIKSFIGHKVSFFKAIYPEGVRNRSFKSLIL